MLPSEQVAFTYICRPLCAPSGHGQNLSNAPRPLISTDNSGPVPAPRALLCGYCPGHGGMLAVMGRERRLPEFTPPGPRTARG